MGTQQSTLIMTLVDNMSGAAKTAQHALHTLGHEAHVVQHIMEALGLAFGLHEAVEFMKEAVVAAAETEDALTRLKTQFKASTEEVKHLHHALIEMATATDTPLEGLEKAALRLNQLGMGLHEVLELLPELARASSAGYGSVDKLAAAAPRMMHALRIGHEQLGDALGAIVSASERMPEGERSFDAIADSILKVSPLLAKLGWQGQAGLVKYLAYLHQLSTDLGSTDAAAQAFEDIVAGIASPRMATRFKQAFGKTFDIKAAVDAAVAKGMDPLKAYLEYAEEAGRRGHPVFVSPEQQKAMETMLHGGRLMVAEQRKIGEESKHIVDEKVEERLKSAGAQLRKLATVWHDFQVQFGEMEIDAGVVKALMQLIPMLEQVTKQFGDLLHSSDEIGEDFLRIFSSASSFYERMQAIEDFAFGRGAFGPKDPNEIPLPRPRPSDEAMARPRRPSIRYAAYQTAEDVAARHGSAPYGFGLPGFGELTSEWPPTNAAPRGWDDGREAMVAPGAALEAAAEALARISTTVADHVEDRAPPTPLPRTDPRKIKYGAMDLPWGKSMAQAGRDAGQGFSRALDEELAKAGGIVSGWAAKFKSMLDFTAGPKVEPLLPGRRAGPGWLAKSRLRGSHSDANPVPIE
jgi:TP901 family phage tail tape measure protein